MRIPFCLILVQLRFWRINLVQEIAHAMLKKCIVKRFRCEKICFPAQNALPYRGE